MTVSRKVNWLGAFKDFGRSGLSRAKYVASQRFKAFYTGKCPGYSTLCMHFKKLADSLPEVQAAAPLSSEPVTVSVTQLSANDIRTALNPRSAESRASFVRRSVAANRPVAIHLSNGSSIEFASPNPELFALQALFAQTGGRL